MFNNIRKDFGKILIVFLLFYSFIGYYFVFAQIDDSIKSPLINEIGVSVESHLTVYELFTTGIKWFYTIVLALGVLFVLISAYNFITGAGNTEKLKKAREGLKYAVIAIAIALVAGAVPVVLKGIMENPSGGGETNPCSICASDPTDPVCATQICSGD